MKNPIISFEGEYSFLSNFYPVKIFYKIQMYPSVEHAYQAQKTKSENENMHFEICKLAKGSDAKRLERKLKKLGQMCSDWNQKISISTMRSLVEQKFSKSLNSKLAEKLISTGDAELIGENDWGDTFWGVCEGKGQNYLGKILMEVRSDLQNCGI
ncbi:MAG: NADAR family protein [Patescibacteria group bacterium]